MATKGVGLSAGSASAGSGRRRRKSEAGDGVTGARATGALNDVFQLPGRCPARNGEQLVQGARADGADGLGLIAGSRPAQKMSGSSGMSSRRSRSRPASGNLERVDP